MKPTLAVVTALFACLAMGRQAPAGKPHMSPAAPATTPTQADVENVLKRMYGYDPSIQWKVFVVRKAPVPGMTEVLLNVNNEFQHLFITADGHHAFSGDLMPFGPDLYAIPRKKLMAADGVAHGPAKPAVTLVEFSDLQCPHCKQAHPVLEKLAADFPQMKIIFQQYPLASHPWAAKAAHYADCAGRMNNDAAWKFIGQIYENQGGIALAIADEKLKELAKAAGLEGENLSACAATPATEARVKKSMELGDSLGVMGTPTIFVNGRMLEGVGVVPYEKVKAIVQYEIEHAGK